MVVNARRYERLTHLFATLRRDQLEAMKEVLDSSQWVEFMGLYRDMAAEAEANEIDGSHGSRSERL